MSIARKINDLKASLPPYVEVVAVSKFHPASIIMEAYNAGQRMFGENKVQELIAKYQQLPDDIQWHFIGTLQTNKVKYIAHFIDTIQSIDSLRLLKEVDRQAAKCNRRIRVLLEVHIAKETSKHGFSMDECLRLFDENQLATYKNVVIAGLMGMATFTDDTGQVEHEFQQLKQLFDTIEQSGKAGDSFHVLSMGMSDDYPVAVQNGSTMIRTGTKIFGERKIFAR